MSRESELVKNTSILAIGTFFPKLAIFITLPILTACLTKKEYGTYDLIVTLVSLVLPIATLQIQSAAFRFLIDFKDDEEQRRIIISNIYAFVIPITIITVIVIFFCLIKESIIIRFVICSYFLFDILSNVNKQITRGVSRNDVFAVSASISSVVQILFVIIFVVVMKQHLLGAVLAISAAELISTVFLTVIGNIPKYIRINNVDVNVIKKMLGYSWPMVPNSFSQWIMHVSDRLVITGFIGLTANAEYAVAYKIPSILSFAHATFNMAWQENASIAVNDEGVSDYYSKMFKVLFDIVAGFLMILIGITPILFMILVHGDYAEAYMQIPILYLGLFFLSLSSFWGGIYVAYKKSVTVGVTTVLAACINLIIDITTIRWIGLYAASISTLISYLLLCVFRIIGVKSMVTIKYGIKHIVIILAIIILQCILSYFHSVYIVILNLIIGFSIGIYLNRNVVLELYKKFMQRWELRQNGCRK